ncbi:MAG TPA: cytochrome c oxidase assembly protein [Planctomycetota bacterium]|nr:cytochrome c oxidase assembly protein [Planctomycetota bacterium]
MNDAMTTSTEGQRPLVSRNRRLLLVLATISIGMGGFGFALSKFYTLLCEATGSQISPNNADVASAAPVATGRFVEVFFEKKVFDRLPVRFFPDQDLQKVQVGVEHKNVYHFQNLSNRTVHFRPIHQISPPVAGQHFGMRVCFCFQDQTIRPGETKDFEVSYTFAPELLAEVSEVRLCYSLHEIDDADRGSDRGLIEAKIEGGGAIVTPGYRADDAR